MAFIVDSRIATTAVILKESTLSTIFIKNDSNFLWFVLVPRVDNVQEIYQLAPQQRQYLMEEITWLSEIVSNYCKPAKLNIGALGNIVSQLHIHIVARFENDPVWPHGVWQPASVATPYDDASLTTLTNLWKKRLNQASQILI